MPLEITYAIFAGAVGGAVLFLPPDDRTTVPNSPRGSISLSLGHDKSAPGNAGGGAARHGFAGVDYLPSRRLFGEVRPILAAGVTPGGGAFVSAGIRQDYLIGRFRVTPHIGVAAYHSGRHGWEPRELLQFRTGLDVYYPVTEKVSLGIGYHHMSNAQLTSGIAPFSAGVNVIRVNVLYKL